MANTVFGPYAKTNWQDGLTMGNQNNLRNLETQAAVALNGINPLLSGPFVYSGITCTKDGTNANQLDIASGVAFITMSDGSTGQIVVSADNTHTTSTPSTTYHLYLQPDGTWYWSTSSSPATNSLAICDVTTDGSGNISAVTDKRSSTGSSSVPGIPIVMTRQLRKHVTSTAATTILNWPVSVTGIYRISAYFTNNGTSPGIITFNYGWTEADTNAGRGNFFYILDPGLDALQAHSTVAGSYPCNNVTVAAAAGSSITSVYTNTAGTPNDYVSAIIERIG